MTCWSVGLRAFSEISAYVHVSASPAIEQGLPEIAGPIRGSGRPGAPGRDHPIWYGEQLDVDYAK